VNAQEAERARLATEKARARRARYEANHPERQKHHGTNPDHNPRRPRYDEYDFRMWDGEAPTDTGYSLFGSSEGHEICHPHLSTEECFDLLLQAKAEEPNRIDIIFGGRYDFDEICRQSIPLTRLSQLKERGHCTWHGYTLKQAEGKFFELKKGGVCIKVYEIFGWFHKAYIKALDDYGIGTAEEREKIRLEKANRSTFLWRDIENIRTYYRIELKLGPPLMERIREICLQAGFNPRDWYGPSALALEALRKNKITSYMGDIPSVVKRASQYAYAGGRFEPIRGGILHGIYSVDKNSAYMAAALELPDLSSGEWRRGREFEPGKFAVYHIRYNTPIDPMRPDRIYPLFCRHDNGTVEWPHAVEGWYWAPEAELVKDDSDATFIEAYVFDSTSTARPFAFVLDWFSKRLLLESLPESNPSRKAGKAFKWALASVYGQLARAVGWDRKRGLPPKYHQLEWAGYITSRCRADMHKVASNCGDKLIGIDTDSVTAMCPITVDEGTALGQWKTTIADYGVFFQSGVFALSKDGEWMERKARGIEEDVRTRRLPVSPEMMISAIYDGTVIELPNRKRYVSIRMALNHRLQDMGKWMEQSGRLKFGGEGKRVHRENTCYKAARDGKRVPVCRSAEEHTFVHRPAMTFSDFKFGKIPKSQPHLLPWVDDVSHLPDKNLIADLLWIDPDSVDEEDVEWLTQLIA
jgi:hypothetical protein